MVCITAIDEPESCKKFQRCISKFFQCLDCQYQKMHLCNLSVCFVFDFLALGLLVVIVWQLYDLLTHIRIIKMTYWGTKGLHNMHQSGGRWVRFQRLLMTLVRFIRRHQLLEIMILHLLLPIGDECHLLSHNYLHLPVGDMFHLFRLMSQYHLRLMRLLS